MTEAERFGPRLRELREAAGLTQQQLADKAGLKIGGLRDLEQGINKGPRWDTVVALAKALGVDCTAFMQEPSEGSAERSRGRPPKAEAAPEPTKRKKKKE